MNIKKLLFDYHESQMPKTRESHSKYIEKCVDDFLRQNEHIKCPKCGSIYNRVHDFKTLKCDNCDNKFKF